MKIHTNLLGLVLLCVTALCSADTVNLENARYNAYIREFKTAHMFFEARGIEPSEAFKEVFEKIQNGEFIIERDLMQQAFLDARKSSEGLL